MNHLRTAAAVAGTVVFLVLLLSCFWLFDGTDSVQVEPLQRTQRDTVDVQPRQNTLQLSLVPDDVTH